MFDPAMRATQRQFIYPARVSEREFLRDHPAHRDAEYMRRFDAERVEQPGRIVGHLPDRVSVVRLVGLADAAVIEDDCAKTLRERRDLLREAVASGRKPMDHQQRLAFAMNFIMDIYVVDPRFRH